VNHTRRLLGALNVALLTCSSSAQGQWAPLPTGALQTQELTSVTAEITLRNLLVPPESYRDRLPTGYRAWTLQDLAKLHPGAASFLANHPDHHADAISTLSFVLLDSLKVDGELQAGRQTMAYWWVPVVPARDSAASEGPIGNVELAGWWSDAATRRRLATVWPPTSEAEIQISSRGPVWELSLRRPDLSIQATCTPRGERVRVQYHVPTVDTLWAAGPRPRRYTLFTYYGHMSRPCAATWILTGTHPIAGAHVRLRQLADWTPVTELLDGWRAQAAIYRR